MESEQRELERSRWVSGYPVLNDLSEENAVGSEIVGGKQ